MKEIVKQGIADCFLRLCEEIPVKKIKVKDIIGYCNISKQTFYNYFHDKYDLINYIYESSVEKILDRFYNNSNSLEFNIQGVYEMCLANKGYYTAIVNIEGQNSFRHYFYEHTNNYYVERLAEKYGKQALTKSVLMAIDFNCAGTQKLFMDWVINGMKESPKFMRKRTIDCMPQELWKYYLNNEPSIDA